MVALASTQKQLAYDALQRALRVDDVRELEAAVDKVVAVLGRAYVAEAGLSDRVSYVDGNALKTGWPGDQDVVLMSYLLSGVPGSSHEGLIADAEKALVPGGRIVIHMVHEDRSGPGLAALWQLQHTAFTPEARSVDTGTLTSELEAGGFGAVEVVEMIPRMTMLATGLKAA